MAKTIDSLALERGGGVVDQCNHNEIQCPNLLYVDPVPNTNKPWLIDQSKIKQLILTVSFKY